LYHRVSEKLLADALGSGNHAMVWATHYVGYEIYSVKSSPDTLKSGAEAMRTAAGTMRTGPQTMRRGNNTVRTTPRALK